MIYADTSFLGSLYVRDTNSGAALGYVERERPRLPFLFLHWPGLVKGASRQRIFLRNKSPMTAESVQHAAKSERARVSIDAYIVPPIRSFELRRYIEDLKTAGFFRDNPRRTLPDMLVRRRGAGSRAARDEVVAPKTGSSFFNFCVCRFRVSQLLPGSSPGQR